MRGHQGFTLGAQQAGVHGSVTLLFTVGWEKGSCWEAGTALYGELGDGYTGISIRSV